MAVANGWDLIVVGAGTAGMPCAITAAEAAARVCVLEKDSEVGGTLYLSAGQMSAAGSRRQIDKGIGDSPQTHFDDVMQLGHGKNDPAVVRLAVDEAASTLDWLDDLGFPFPDDMPIVYYGHEPYTTARTSWGAEMGVSILNTVKPAFEEAVAFDNVSLYLEHRLVGLIVENGAVVGVRAEGPDGSVEFRAPATVLATGGYASSSELWAEFHPQTPCLLGARDTSTGDGILVAREIGAAVRGAELYLPTHGCIPDATTPGRTDIWEAFGNLIPQYRPPVEIIVNARGERFQAEDEPSADARERALVEQGGQAWIVLDEAAIDEDNPVVVGWSAEMLRDEATRGTRVWSADSPAALARAAGIDPAGLERTVDEYNAAVRAGDDPLGRRHFGAELTTAPYYAIAMAAGAVVGFAGLTVDGELRVLDEGGRPIPNLFAAGELLGCGALMGDFYAGGMSVTPAMSFGRILGRRLAAAHAEGETALAL